MKLVPSGLGSGYGYYVTPSSTYYRDETIFIAGYYCTEKDAQDAGYPNGYLPDGSRSGDASPL